MRNLFDKLASAVVFGLLALLVRPLRRRRP